MKKSSLNFIATIVLAIIFSFFMPWWSVMLAAFLAALIFTLKGFSVFSIPFLAIFLYWMTYTFMLSNANDFILANKIAVLLPLGGNPYILIVVTALLGGIAAGVSGILGHQLKSVLNKK